MLLIEAGADLKTKDATGHTPLQRAAQGGHTECERVLVEALFADSGSNQGQTPIPGNDPNEKI